MRSSSIQEYWSICRQERWLSITITVCDISKDKRYPNISSVERDVVCFITVMVYDDHHLTVLLSNDVFNITLIPYRWRMILECILCEHFTNKSRWHWWIIRCMRVHSQCSITWSNFSIWMMRCEHCSFQVLCESNSHPVIPENVEIWTTAVQW